MVLACPAAARERNNSLEVSLQASNAANDAKDKELQEALAQLVSIVLGAVLCCTFLAFVSAHHTRMANTIRCWQAVHVCLMHVRGHHRMRLTMNLLPCAASACLAGCR